MMKMCVANMKQMGKSLKKWKMRKSQILWYLRQIFYEINVDFLCPGNLVSLSVITRASLDFKTSFLRLVELVIFTVFRLRRDANNYYWETLVSFAPLSFWKVATLSVFDCLCIILNMIIFSGPTLSETYRHQVNVFISFLRNSEVHSTQKDKDIDKSIKTENMQIFPVLVPLLLPVTQICLTGSLYTVLAVAIERFLAVTRYFCHRLHLLWEDLKVKIVQCCQHFSISSIACHPKIYSPLPKRKHTVDFHLTSLRHVAYLTLLNP